MAMYEVSDEGLREIVESINVPCERCGRQATKVLRCRTYHSVVTLWCTRCLLVLQSKAIGIAIRPTGHMHCRACPDTGRFLADVVEIFDL